MKRFIDQFMSLFAASGALVMLLLAVKYAPVIGRESMGMQCVITFFIMLWAMCFIGFLKQYLKS